jgi:DNA replication and repair protein RecF
MPESAPISSARHRPLVRRLMLRDFRSYAAIDVAFDSELVVLRGENGVGKTNLIEALSLFAQGRGLRRAEVSECARVSGGGGFAVSIEIEEQGDRRQLGVGLEPNAEGGADRLNRIDRAAVASSRAFSEHIRLVWLTPAMDGLFPAPRASGGASSTG